MKSLFAAAAVRLALSCAPLALSCAPLALFCALPAHAQAGSSLFTDSAFTRGFNVTAARHPAPKIELGPLRFPEGPDEPPVWRLAQWGSRHLIEPATQRV
jgi:hypothetical protein